MRSWRVAPEREGLLVHWLVQLRLTLLPDLHLAAAARTSPDPRFRTTGSRGRPNAELPYGVLAFTVLAFTDLEIRNFRAWVGGGPLVPAPLRGEGHRRPFPRMMLLAILFLMTVSAQVLPLPSSPAWWSTLEPGDCSISRSTKFHGSRSGRRPGLTAPVFGPISASSACTHNRFGMAATLSYGGASSTTSLRVESWDDPDHVRSVPSWQMEYNRQRLIWPLTGGQLLLRDKAPRNLQRLL